MLKVYNLPKCAPVWYGFVDGLVEYLKQIFYEYHPLNLMLLCALKILLSFSFCKLLYFAIEKTFKLICYYNIQKDIIKQFVHVVIAKNVGFWLYM